MALTLLFKLKKDYINNACQNLYWQVLRTFPVKNLETNTKAWTLIWATYSPCNRTADQSPLLGVHKFLLTAKYKNKMLSALPEPHHFLLTTTLSMLTIQILFCCGTVIIWLCLVEKLAPKCSTHNLWTEENFHANYNSEQFLSFLSDILDSFRQG